MNFFAAANDSSFTVHTFNRKEPKQLPPEVGFRFKKYEESIVNGDIVIMLEHCEAMYQILTNAYGDDNAIPVSVIDYIYPYSNTNLIPEVRLAMITFLFNKHPNKRYFQRLKENAEQLIENGNTVEEISQKIRDQVSNNLVLWRALSWSQKESPFPLKKKVA